MKRLFYISFFIIVLFTFSACGNAEAENKDVQVNPVNEDGQVSEPASEPQGSQDAVSVPEESGNKENILIAYFSWAENAVQDENIDAVTSPSVTVPGNVAQLANWISEETGGDLFSIQVTNPYPVDEDEVLSRANDEKAEGIHPELIKTVDNMDSYDIVFLGYPNWWYSCPMAVFSFIDEHDLNGKEIYLFCSHGTGGLAGSVQDITAALPEGTVISDNVFHVYQDDTASAKEDLQNWLNELQ